MAKKKKRKLKKIKFDDEFYGYLKTGGYLRQELGTKYGCVEYRIKEIKPGVKILICIKKKKGKRGGRTKALALLRHYKVDLRRYRKKGKTKIYRFLKKVRKMKKETKD